MKHEHQNWSEKVVCEPVVNKLFVGKRVQLRVKWRFGQCHEGFGPLLLKIGDELEARKLLDLPRPEKKIFDIS